jgi:hypothetical protein
MVLELPKNGGESSGIFPRGIVRGLLMEQVEDPLGLLLDLGQQNVKLVIRLPVSVDCHGHQCLSILTACFSTSLRTLSSITAS